MMRWVGWIVVCMVRICGRRGGAGCRGRKTCTIVLGRIVLVVVASRVLRVVRFVVVLVLVVVVVVLVLGRSRQGSWVSKLVLVSRRPRQG